MVHSFGLWFCYECMSRFLWEVGRHGHYHISRSCYISCPTFLGAVSGGTIITIYHGPGTCTCLGRLLRGVFVNVYH